MSMADPLPPPNPFAGTVPSKFIPEIRHKILLAIRNGNHWETACSFAGVPYQTFRNWMVKGEQYSLLDPNDIDQVKQEYVEFYDAVHEADSQAEVLAMQKWKAAWDKDWKAARDFLARRHPQRWGQRVEVSVKNNDDEILELLDALDGIGGKEIAPPSRDFGQLIELPPVKESKNTDG